MHYDCSSFGLVLLLVDSKRIERVLLAEVCEYLAACLLHSLYMRNKIQD